MTIKEKMAAISKILFENSEIKFNQYKTSDNKILNCDTELIVGAKVDELFEDGTMQPLPDGEYQIPEEKITIKIENGMVKEIMKVTEEIPVEEIKQEKVEEVKAEENKPAEEVIPAWFTAFKEEILTKLSAIENKNVELAEEVQLIAEQPAGTPVKTVKVGFIEQTKKDNSTSKEKNMALLLKVRQAK